MSNPTLIMPYGAKQAHKWIDSAPTGVVIEFRRPGRTVPQNKRFWAMLTDVSRQVQHKGKRYSPDEWKLLFMQACGHEVAFMEGLSGDFFPIGFRSSKLSKEQMGELMEFIEAWGAEHGVVFTGPGE